ncbi:MAG TPA: hypothetical protein VGC01_03345 [Mucilaginibacter sp.]
MTIENPAALRFIIDDDLYLLNSDKTLADTPAPTVAYSAPTETIVSVVAESTPTETPIPEFKYLGSNKKAFLIIVHYTDNEFINEAHLTALQNILKRKELELDDVAIFNTAPHTTVTHDLLTGFFKPKKLLIMGKKAIPLNIVALALNQPKQLDNCMTLYSFSFDEMMSSNDHKKAFWDQMKNL